jgi:hypothetical protein
MYVPTLPSLTATRARRETGAQDEDTGKYPTQRAGISATQVPHKRSCRLQSAILMTPILQVPRPVADLFPTSTPRVCLFENAHLTVLIVHCCGCDGRRMRQIVSLCAQRLVLAVQGEMECARFYRWGSL